MPSEGPPVKSQSEDGSGKRAHEDDAPEGEATSPIRKRLRVEEDPEQEPMADDAGPIECREIDVSTSDQQEDTPSLSSPSSDEDDESIDINLSTPVNEPNSPNDNITDPSHQEPQNHPISIIEESLADIEATLDELVQISDHDVDQLLLRFRFDETSDGVGVEESLWTLLPDEEESRRDEAVFELTRELAWNIRRLYQRRAVRRVSGREYLRMVMAERAELSDASDDGFDQRRRR